MPYLTTPSSRSSLKKYRSPSKLASTKSVQWYSNSYSTLDSSFQHADLAHPGTWIETYEDLSGTFIRDLRSFQVYKFASEAEFSIAVYKFAAARELRLGELSSDRQLFAHNFLAKLALLLHSDSPSSVPVQRALERLRRSAYGHVDPEEVLRVVQTWAPSLSLAEQTQLTRYSHALPSSYLISGAQCHVSLWDTIRALRLKYSTVSPAFFAETPAVAPVVYRTPLNTALQIQDDLALLSYRSPLKTSLALRDDLALLSLRRSRLYSHHNYPYYYSRPYSYTYPYWNWSYPYCHSSYYPYWNYTYSYSTTLNRLDVDRRARFGLSPLRACPPYTGSSLLSDSSPSPLVTSPLLTPRILAPFLSSPTHSPRIISPALSPTRSSIRSPVRSRLSPPPASLGKSPMKSPVKSSVKSSAATPVNSSVTSPVKSMGELVEVEAPEEEVSEPPVGAGLVQEWTMEEVYYFGRRLFLDVVARIVYEEARPGDMLWPVGKLELGRLTEVDPLDQWSFASTLSNRLHREHASVTEFFHSYGFLSGSSISPQLDSIGLRRMFDWIMPDMTLSETAALQAIMDGTTSGYVTRAELVSAVDDAARVLSMSKFMLQAEVKAAVERCGYHVGHNQYTVSRKFDEGTLDCALRPSEVMPFFKSLAPLLSTTERRRIAIYAWSLTVLPDSRHLTQPEVMRSLTLSKPLMTVPPSHPASVTYSSASFASPICISPEKHHANSSSHKGSSGSPTGPLSPGLSSKQSTPDRFPREASSVERNLETELEVSGQKEGGVEEVEEVKKVEAGEMVERSENSREVKARWTLRDAEEVLREAREFYAASQGSGSTDQDSDQEINQDSS